MAIELEMYLVMQVGDVVVLCSYCCCRTAIVQVQDLIECSYPLFRLFLFIFDLTTRLSCFSVLDMSLTYVKCLPLFPNSA